MQASLLYILSLGLDINIIKTAHLRLQIKIKSLHSTLSEEYISGLSVKVGFCA